ncbi:MAG TPA: hypothetical protein VIK33_11990 [Anaerolineae bacterium]
MTYSSRLSALCDKIIEAGWLAAVVLVPLFFNIWSSRVFEPDKITLLRTVALIMVAAWIVRVIEERAAKPANGEAPARRLLNGVDWRTPLILPTLVLAVVYIIATAASLVPRTSLLGSYQRLQGTYTMFSYMIIFLMIVQNMRRRRQLDRLVTAIVMTSLPIAFYGVLQRVDRDPLPWGGIVTERVAANMGNAIFVAAYLIMAFFLTLGRVIEAFRIILTEEESRVSDILRASAYIFVGAVQLIAFAFAGSRGPLLGWLPGMFVLGLVGLLMLRVTLHSRQTATDAEPAAGLAGNGNSIAGADVIKALLMSLTSVVAAGVAFLLAYSAFPGQTQTELGAVAALIGGLVPLLVVAGIQRSAARWLWASWIFFAIIGAIGLFEINFSDYPLMVELRQRGAFGTLGTLFESESGTGKVRSLIWQGTVELILPHEPIAFPDGARDPLNPIRLLIGYGPESMYVAYNRFYPPDLAHYEARNASPDRSHNETWDSLAITGGIGFVAEQFLFLSVFFFALKFIGWAPNRRAAFLFIAMMIVGGALGAIGWGAIKGRHFMGMGWPGGVAAGLVLYVILFALFHFRISARVYALVSGILILFADVAIFGATFTHDNGIFVIALATGLGLAGMAALYAIGRRAFDETAGQPISISGHVFLIIALFGGMLAHYLEISLAGIAIAATRTYFWTFAGMLVVAGLNWVPADDAEPATTARPEPAPVVKAPPANLPRHKKRKATAARPEPRPSITRPQANWIGPVLAAAMIGALILITLGYNFINTPPVQSVDQLPTSATEVVANSLTRLPYKNNASSPGVLLLFFITWAFGGIVSLTELRRRNILTSGNWPQAAGTYLGVSIGVALVYWIWHASTARDVVSQLLTINVPPPSTLNEYVGRFTRLAENMAGLLGLFYVAVIVIIVSTGLSLIGEARARALPIASEWGLLAGVPVFVVALVLAIAFNFNPIRADIIYKQGQPYIAGNACNGAGNPQAGNPFSQCDLAIAHLKQALKYAPDEDFYMLSLGASYLNKSAAAPDQPPLLVEGSTYESILNLDAERTAFFNRHDALTAARITLEHALQVNPLNTDHSANLARAHRAWSDLAADDTERELRLNQASDFYRQATTLSPHNAQLWNEWALVILQKYSLAARTGDAAAADAALQEAEAKLNESLQLDGVFSKTYLYKASLEGARGRRENAAASFLDALQYKPDPGSGDDWGGNELNIAENIWNYLLQDYLATNNFTETLKVTTRFVEEVPDYLPGWRVLVQVYDAQGRSAEAIDAAQRSLQLGESYPDHWRDQLLMAEALGRAGRLDEALSYAQAALDAAPQDNKAEAQRMLDAIQAALSGSQQPVP